MNMFKNKKNIAIITGIIIAIFIISTISYTYAYFAFSKNDTDTITGNASTASISLAVEKIIPTTSNSNLKLVPLLDSAIGNAVSGMGGKSSCIDSNNNLSCQIYKITVQNTGSTNLRIQGSIQLTADGSNNIFENLKWQQLDSTTQVKENATINGMEESILESTVSINIGETKTFYFALWISEINEDQSYKDYGNFRGIVTFKDSNGNGATATFD